MANYDTPTWGYIVPLESFFKNLPLVRMTDCYKIIQNEDTEEDEIISMVRDLWSELPEFQAYRPKEEDISEDMIPGKWYLIFNEDDLFIKTPTKAYQTIESITNTKPIHTAWTVWG